MKKMKRKEKPPQENKITPAPFCPKRANLKILKKKEKNKQIAPENLAETHTKKESFSQFSLRQGPARSVNGNLLIFSRCTQPTAINLAKIEQSNGFVYT